MGRVMLLWVISKSLSSFVERVIGFEFMKYCLKQLTLHKMAKCSAKMRMVHIQFQYRSLIVELMRDRASILSQ